MENAATAEQGSAAPEIATAPPRRPRALRRAARVAEMIKVGSLTLQLPDGSTHRASASDGPNATIVLKHPRAVHRLLSAGSLGLAEAYIEGWWQTPDLRAVMALAVANEGEWAAMLRAPFWRRGWRRLIEALRPSALFRPPRGVDERDGFDSDFHACWLDATMTQTAAMFGGNDPSLEAAQLRKIHRLCRTLRLAPGLRVLELGCGWGSFAEVAARDYGTSVLAVTTSPMEFDYAAQRIKRAGLAHRVEVRLQHYHDVTGRFDRVAGIETFTALPEDEWPLYCAAIRDRLGGSGVAAFQIVTISERLFEDYRRGNDYVTRFVFPGSVLPTKSRLRRGIIKAGMAWGDEQWFATDYAETAARWLASFQAGWPRIAAMTRGNRHLFDERFKRLWEYYLAYLETGFRAGWMDVGQILIARNG
jgi:cyclopropane-fatty-acyl-phospholipid synthase